MKGGLALSYAPAVKVQTEREEQWEVERRGREEELEAGRRELEEARARIGDLEQQLLKRSVLQGEALERKRAWQPMKQLNGVARIFGIGRKPDDPQQQQQQQQQQPPPPLEHGAGVGSVPGSVGGGTDVSSELADMGDHGAAAQMVPVQQFSELATRYETLSRRAAVLEDEVDPLRKAKRDLEAEIQANKSTIAGLEELLTKSDTVLLAKATGDLAMLTSQHEALKQELKKKSAEAQKLRDTIDSEIASSKAALTRELEATKAELMRAKGDLVRVRQQMTDMAAAAQTSRSGEQSIKEAEKLRKEVAEQAKEIEDLRKKVKSIPAQQQQQHDQQQQQQQPRYDPNAPDPKEEAKRKAWMALELQETRSALTLCMKLCKAACTSLDELRSELFEEKYYEVIFNDFF
jgi:chromosome segregation ATPase